MGRVSHPKRLAWIMLINAAVVMVCGLPWAGLMGAGAGEAVLPVVALVLVVVVSMLAMPVLLLRFHPLLTSGPAGLWVCPGRAATTVPTWPPWHHVEAAHVYRAPLGRVVRVQSPALPRGYVDVSLWATSTQHQQVQAAPMRHQHATGHDPGHRASTYGQVVM